MLREMLGATLSTEFVTAVQGGVHVGEGLETYRAVKLHVFFGDVHRARAQISENVSLFPQSVLQSRVRFDETVRLSSFFFEPGDEFFYRETRHAVELLSWPDISQLRLQPSHVAVVLFF
jgi:hypothetical protein